MQQNGVRDLLPGMAINCPCCGGYTLELFEDTLDIDGNVTAVEICLVCSALVNRSSLQQFVTSPENLVEQQTGRLRMVYPVGRHVHDTLEREMEAFRETLDFFLAQTGNGTAPSSQTYAEIGVGRGMLVRSAAELFARCYAIDLDFALFEATREHIAVPENVFLLNAIDHLPEPVDVVMAWHSLEHVPRLYDLVSSIRNALRPGGHLFFQVPLYRPAHLVESHYVFLNRRSIAVLAEIEGFELVDLWTDHPRACLTGLLRKPAQAGAGVAG